VRVHTTCYVGTPLTRVVAANLPDKPLGILASEDSLDRVTVMQTRLVLVRGGYETRPANGNRDDEHFSTEWLAGSLPEGSEPPDTALAGVESHQFH
jgi:hypothetical protein